MTAPYASLRFLFVNPRTTPYFFQRYSGRHPVATDRIVSHYSIRFILPSQPFLPDSMGCALVCHIVRGIHVLDGLKHSQITLSLCLDCTASPPQNGQDNKPDGDSAFSFSPYTSAMTPSSIIASISSVSIYEPQIMRIKFPLFFVESVSM